MPPPTAPVDALTGLEASRFGVYVHFPYCLSKCPYCDFASAAVEQVPGARYAAAVEGELALRAPAFAGRRVDSVYLGGGTPSLWEPGLVARVLEAVAARFAVAPGAEVTLEANPGAADASRFAGYRAAGVNRLSVGVQSFEKGVLHALGRKHDGAEAERAVLSARAAGFDNVSADFIYGAVGQTAEEAESDARRAVALPLSHLSAYALTLEPELLAEPVPLARAVARGEVALPSDDEALAMSDAVRGVYAAAGFDRYEISNYARPGFHSRHNALYWTGGETLALGAGATGFARTGPTSALRYSNPRGAERYLAAVEAGRLPDGTSERLGSVQLFTERLAMGLRLTCGVDLDAVCRAFDVPYPARRGCADEFVARGLARWNGPRLGLTPAGADLHTELASRLM